MTRLIPSLGNLTIHIVEPGTVITDPETGVEFVVDDAGAVTNQAAGRVWMTRRIFDALRSFASEQDKGAVA